MLSRNRLSWKILSGGAAVLLVLPGPLGSAVGRLEAQSTTPVYSTPTCDPRYDTCQATTAAQPSGSETRQRDGSGRFPWELAVVPPLLLAVLLGGGEGKAAKVLEKDGPQFPEAERPGVFEIRGFGRDGWPMVVDFQPQPNTQTILSVTFTRKHHVELLLDPDGRGGRQLRKLDMPANGWARKPKPATYTIYSQYVAPSPYSGQAAPIAVYGIGGGPRAIGSVAIEQLVFRRSPLGNAPFALEYSAKSPFNRVQMEVVRLESGGEGIKLFRVMKDGAEDIAIGRHDGVWNGLDAGNGVRSVGIHRFQVRAWFTSDDKSWVGAVAPSLLKVE